MFLRGKAGLNSALVGSSEAVVGLLGTKGSVVLANALRSGSNIYGAAAMKSAAKMLRNNVITGIASVVILSSGDVVNIFRGRISGSQLLKNVANTTVTTVGATAGFIAGSLIPIPFVGSIAGSMIGGALANKAAGKALDNFIEDDADNMVGIIESVFVGLVEDYLLTKHEVEDVVDYIGKNVTGKDLKDMYASDNREYYAKMLILPYIERKAAQREHIKAIGAEGLQRGCGLSWKI